MILSPYRSLALVVLAVVSLGAQPPTPPPLMEPQLWPEGDSVRVELPIGFTAEEWEQRGQIASQGRSTDPPPSPVRNLAEWERMQGVLIRYPLGIPVDLVRQFAEDVIVYCLVSTSQQSAAVSQFQAAGVNLDQVEFILGNTDSYWTRDYGPWWVVDGTGDIAVVDFTYNRPRPNDNQAPWKVANFLGSGYYAMDLVHTGGNYMTDAFGISASSDLVYVENPGWTAGEILAEMGTYYGVHTYHVLDDPNNTYIDHIDCWGKFLAPDKVLIRSVPPTHSQYDEIEAVAEYFAGQICAYGTPYRVYRVYTPNDEPYTNSLILNDKIYVPMVPWGGDNNQAAIQAYQDACPGYTIVPVDPPAANPWLSTDALHCRAKGIPDQGYLEIQHLPPPVPWAPDSMALVARIVAHSGWGLIVDSIRVVWKTERMDQLRFQVGESVGNDSFAVALPAVPVTTDIHYLWEAADSSGRHERLPLAGEFVVEAAGVLTPGDVTMDGEFTIADVLAVFDGLAGTSWEGYQIDLADVNQDGAVTLLDGMLLLTQLSQETEP
ncbi:MAG: peptidylarginine deiminase [Candidatus Neomarinimicrobiota bacterium]|nr:MAG: peptidylarginine deiminase [Candidatus Neomarinimicrobiota bacterium]